VVAEDGAVFGSASDLSGDGEIGDTSSDENSEALPVSQRTLSVASGRSRAFFEDVDVNGTPVRLLTVPIEDGFALQVGRPLDEVRDVLDRLRWILLILSVVGVGLAAVLGLAVARAALVPVRRLTTTAETIAETREMTQAIDVSGTDEMSRLAQALNTMLGALDASLRAQRQLVADASHELRTPLTSMRTNIELLARDDIPSTKRQEMLDDVTAQLEELSALVTDVVDLARGEEAHSVRTDVRLDELVESVIERMQRHAPELTVEATLDNSVAAVDRPRIERAVANLIDNAVKWSPAGGVVEVRLSEGMLSVRDHGPGISDDDLPFVFDRFYRSDKARTLPGSGLGLAIVRQVAEDHGGWARVENAPDGGAIMRLCFGPQVSTDPDP
jgi:two-component system sensor histidine kinase MprB